MKLAICYDRINKFGGAERVLMAMHELWPDAPIYTLTYNKELATWAADWKIVSSFLQKIPLLGNKHELFPPLAPLVWEQFNFNEYDVVISVTSSEAKSIITSPHTKHICYCLTPTRYFWSGYYEYLARPGFGVAGRVVRWLFVRLATVLRVWDFYHAQRPAVMVGISEEVCRRIRKYYRRNAQRIYPPVQLGGGKLLKTKSYKTRELKHAEPYFLVVSRLVPYKRVDIVVEAFTRLGWPLKIVGSGSQLEILRKKAGEGIEFLSDVDDEMLAALYRECIAFIFPANEDFGIVPLEAQGFGKPVIAYRRGGALETIIEYKTGVFFDNQSAEGLIQLFQGLSYSDQVDFKKVIGYFKTFKPQDCMANAAQFSKKRFQDELTELVDSIVK